jgi:exodeoxyribonuclease III
MEEVKERSGSGEKCSIHKMVSLTVGNAEGEWEPSGTGNTAGGGVQGTDYISNSDEVKGGSQSKPTGEVVGVAVEVEVEEESGGEEEMKGERLLKSDECDDDWSDQEEEMEENLSYHDDSLSVMKGMVKTPQNEVIPMWVTTDSGSMTQLMQESYARQLKFKRRPIPQHKRFGINGPGGGREEVEEYVIVPLTIKCKRERIAEQGYGDCESEEIERTIKMKFGLCSMLPVPVLWGGNQMRKHELLDYHTQKTLSLKMNGNRYITPSSSWMTAANEMKDETSGRNRKACRSFIPSRERLANLVVGGRLTFNMEAILYPGRDNIVRVARHNARVDEGYNEVLITNHKEFEETYGNWVVPIDSVCNGEAFFVVRNNAEQPIRLSAGALKLEIKPTVIMPRILMPREVLKLDEQHEITPNIDKLPRKEGRGDQDLSVLLTSRGKGVDRELETGEEGPLRFMTWNCNGLALRMKRGDIAERFYDQVGEKSPDILCLQEVKLQSEGEDRSTVLRGSVDEKQWEAFMKPLKAYYDAYLSLSSKRYGGQAVLVRKEHGVPHVSYNMGGESGHYKSGRFIKLEFKNMVVRAVYAPFNGKGSDKHYQRRRDWDEQLRNELAAFDFTRKARFLLGDLNVVHADSDMTDNPNFWFRQGRQDGPEGDRGFGGTTYNERKRFKQLIMEAGMADTFHNPIDDSIRPRHTFRGEGMFLNKGLKLDYMMADKAIQLSGGIKSSEILAGTYSRDGFMGSDHAPLWCELHPRWLQRKAQLESLYVRRERFFGKDVLGTLFTKTGATHSLPKIQRFSKTSIEKRVAKPALFPDHLWEFVEPSQRPLVQARFDKYTDKEYLGKCIEDIVEKLDIQKREECYTPPWFKGDRKTAKEELFVRAQAVANPHIYFHPDPDHVAMAKDVVAEVVTTGEKPFKCRPRKFAVVQQAFLKAKTSIMLRMKQLEDTNSEWCHGLVLVAYDERIQAFMKKHGEEAMTKMFEPEHETEVATFFRLCVDLRMLNARTVPDRFPLPRIDDLLESVPRNCGRYSISDIADAFFKCELKKEDRHKTAFRTHDRHLQFAVLPQGFINSPSVFCRLIARTFEGMPREVFSAYIDDVLNHQDDLKGHLATQQEVYDRLAGASLTLKLSKTHLNYDSVKFLGHILTKDGRLPDPEAVEAIREWKDPTTAKEVRSFLGSTLYYREYIYGYSNMAMPLYDLIKKGVVVAKEWKDEVHGKACQQIKDALTSKPVLMQVDNTKPFRLKVDACRVGRGLGCILEQQNNDNKWQPVSYYSESLSKTERDYSATELECKALHDCILHYAVYLKYIPHFEVFSDHNALRYMVNADNTTTNGRLMRYLLALQEYNFSIYYRKGTENCDADAVSRLTRSTDQPVYKTEEELSKENGIVSKNMLDRARALDKRNEKLEKNAKKLLQRLARQHLTEMSLLNDHILAEGVENLESESGRARFFKNLQEAGLRCSRDKLDETLNNMRVDKGEEETVEEETTERLDVSPKLMSMLGVCQGIPRGNVSREEPTDREQVELESESESESDEDSDEEEPEAENPFTSEDMRVLLAETVKEINNQLLQEDRGKLPYSPREAKMDKIMGSEKELEEKRWDMRSRVEELRNLRPHRIILNRSRAYNLRKREDTEYRKGEGVKTQPNWMRLVGEDKPKTSPVNEKLVGARKAGSKKVIVMESLIPGDTGWGLFAKKAIKEGDLFCTYEGPEVPLEHLEAGYGNKDYVIEAIKNHQTKESVCMDSPDARSCYGRYAQDPIDEDLVNAKIVWRKGKMVLVATVPIEEGDEIYVHYGPSYWMSRLDYLDGPSRARMEPLVERLKKSQEGQHYVHFSEDSTLAYYDKGKDTADSVAPIEIQEDGEVTKPPAMDYQTRMDRLEVREGDEEKSEEEVLLELEQTLLDELSIENVKECEELANEVQFLNGRKFEDEGRLYEIMQVRYEPEWEKVIGFRRPLSGKTPHKDDGSSFCVYGKEGLYELSERYLLQHPEERNDVKWPTNKVEWAREQKGDKELRDIVQMINERGGGPIQDGRNKYALKDTEGKDRKMLVRIVTDSRKGEIIQSMVPESLKKATLKMHHEGYGHMGANRMLETIRLRYFWSGMDKDIIEHATSCINCKLRKSYQRKAKVPLMLYDDTSRPLDRVHVDLTGPLPSTKLGNKYIMVVKDYLTKYVWLIPLKTKTAMEVAEAFVGEFVCHCGVPGRLVSDRGNEFVNQLLTNISKVMGVNRISTTPYNPRADGFVENHNKTLKDQLFHFVDNLKQDDWDVYLPTVQLMYNTTVSLATGFTPMLLMTGREARMPSLSHMASEEIELRKDVLSNAYVLKMIENMRGYQDFALSQTEKNKGRFNVRVKQPLEFVEYEVGQQFMRVRRPISQFKSADEKTAWKISAKLLERYEGPYVIVSKVNPILYEAEIDGKLVRVHAVNMKPF